MRQIKRLLSLVLMLALLIPAVPALEQTAQAAAKYYIEVDITNQIVTVYYDNDRTESGIVRQMPCSSGKNDKTPRGTFTMPEKKASTERTEWHPLFGGYWGKWCSRITGHILFHSIPYTSKGGSQPSSMVKALGTADSSGCIRLRDADAYWIAMNCHAGTKVRIYKSYVVNAELHELLLDRSFSLDEETYAEYIGIASALEEGCTGEDVMKLQARLNLLGYAAGNADGVFGPATTAAVKAFQAEKGLTQNGRVTSRIWNYIFADDAPYAPISIGSSGLHVKELQEALKTLKLYSGAITGVYDSATSNAVRLYQSAYALTVNGKVSSSLRKTIVSKAAEVAKKFGDSDYKAVMVSTSTSMAKVKVSSTLKLRATASTSAKSLASMTNGTVVTVLEKGSTWSKVQYNGKVGYCKNSYLTFYTETSHSLEFESIVPDPNATPTPTPDPNATPTPTPDPNATPKPVASTDTLSIGSEGEAVVTLQRALKELCFYTGELTGVYDEATAEAVKAFQSYNKLPVDGVATTVVQVWALDIAEEIKAQFGDVEYELATTETIVTKAKVKVSSSLILRQTASTSGKKVASLKNGAIVTVQEKGSTWSKVQYDGKVGYLMNKYLTFYTETIVSKDYAVAPTPSPTPDPNATPKPVASEQTLELGSEGTEVVQLQRALSELKLYSGELSGVYDDATEAAVKTFQSVNKLTADGKATTAVQTKILDNAESVKKQFSGSDYTATISEVAVQQAKVSSSSSLKVRKSANNDATVLTKLKTGTVVNVLEKKSSWTKIEYQGIVGYCKNSYLKFFTSTALSVTYEPLPSTAPTVTPAPVATLEPTATPAPTATAEPTVEPTATAEPVINQKVQYAVVKADTEIQYASGEVFKTASVNSGEYFKVIHVYDDFVSVNYNGCTAVLPMDFVEIVDEEPKAADPEITVEATPTADATAEPIVTAEATPEATATAEATPSAAPAEDAAEELQAA